MDTQIQHDPRTKSQIKEAIYTFLYEPTLKQFKARLEQIISKNCLAQKTDDRSFSYKAVVYKSDDATVPLKKVRLAPTLYDLMDQYLVELDQLNRQEIPYVVGFINQVLNASNEFGDYIKLFPDVVHRPLNKMIAHCPCKTAKLTEDAVMDLLIRNQTPITLIKRRLVTNLLI